MELAYERGLRAWVAERGHAWEDLRYARPDAGGETLAVRLSPAGPPRGVVLAVHGAGNDALFALVGLFKELLSRGYEVFTFDMDGHGRRSTTRLSPASVGGAVAAAALRSGAEERGIPLHAVGISLGGAILLGALPFLSPAPASAALLCAPLRIHLSWPAIRRELGTPLLRTLWRERGHYGLTGLIPSFGPFRRDTFPLRLGVPAGPGAFGYVAVLNQTLDALSLEDAARATRTPVLLEYGTRDRLVPLEQGERLASLLPHGELLALEGETHLTTPLAPRAVTRLLRWLEEHQGAGALVSRPPRA